MPGCIRSRFNQWQANQNLSSKSEFDHEFKAVNNNDKTRHDLK